MPDNIYFLDASYVIALSVSQDEFHEQAIKWAQEIQRTKSKLITTTAVLLEIGNSLARQRYRSAAIKLLNALESDPTIKIINMSGKIYQAALRLYRERQDKEWGLTDCASFVVMKQ